MSQFEINLIWDSSVLSQPNAAQIESSLTSAAQVFASNFSNPVTLNLHVGWGEIEGQAIEADAVAESDPQLVFRSYSQVQGALPALPAVNPSSSNTVALTDVQAGAIGLGPTVVNGYIGFSSASNFYYDQTSDDTVQGYWLASAFDHEVSEVMGRVAVLGDAGSAANSVLDFYRYTAAGVRTFDPSVPAVFTLDGNVSQAISFNSDPQGDLGDWDSDVGGDPFNAFTLGSNDPLSGYDLKAMIAIGWTPTGATWDTAIFNAMSEEWLGRPLRDGEANSYLFDFARGETLSEFRQTLLHYTEGVQHTDFEVTSLYQTWMGRSPTANELSTWEGLVYNGDDFTDVRSAILSDPAGRAHTDAVVTSLYDTWFGRDPNASELSVWETLIANGQDFGSVRAALIADGAGQAHIQAEVVALYETYFGRDPTSSELSVWNGLIAGGADFGSVRAALLSDPVGQAHLTAEVTSLYDTYFGRDPTSSELSVWGNLVSQGDDYATVRQTLLADAAGQAHTNATVTSLYDTYFGRDPQAGELGVWQGLIAGGDDFTSVRSALLSDPAGQAHTAATVTSLYDTFFARNPTSGELGVWEGLVGGGAGFDQVKDTLLRDQGSSAAGVHHVALTGLQNLTFDSGWSGAAVSGFSPSGDTISLSRAEFGAINPLDAAHAHQITALDGSTDVVIDLNATHTLLIEQTTLASLQNGDFVFS